MDSGQDTLHCWNFHGNAVHHAVSAKIRTQQELRGAVPERDHIVGVRAQRRSVLARQPEVADLELALVAVQDVAGLEVAVQDPVLVQVVHPAEQLLHQALYLRQQPMLVEKISDFAFRVCLTLKIVTPGSPCFIASSCCRIGFQCTSAMLKGCFMLSLSCLRSCSTYSMTM